MRNPRMIQMSAVRIAVVAITAALCCVAIAAELSDDPKPVAVDAAQCAAFMENEAFDLEDLAEGAEIQRRMFNRMTPPGVSLLQPMFPSVAPFDAANFDESFLGDLLGEDKNTVAVYPLSLALDPATRETIIYNADGKLIAAIPADKAIRSWPTDADPARVILQLDFLPAEDVEPYLHEESRLAESAVPSAKSKSAKTGGPSKRSMGGDPNAFGICRVQRLTNGNLRLTLTNWTGTAEVYSYTVWHTSSVVATIWTNEESNVVTDTNVVWTPVSPPFNGIESEWACLASNQSFSGGTSVWEDATVSSNARIRFYAAAKQVDSDEDGLTDGAEILLPRTDASEIDTDGDDLLDGQDITVDDEDSRYELWAAAGIVHVDGDGLRTFRGEIDAGTDPRDSDTDDDGMPDGEDPEPITPNQEPIVLLRHPPDGQTFFGPAQMELSSEWIYGTQAPSQVVYRVESMIEGSTNEFIVPAGNAQTTNWYAPPGIFRLTARGVDGTGQTGETNQVDIVVVESETFAALTAAEKQAVLENGPRAVDGVEEWAYGYSAVQTSSLTFATSGSRIFSGFVQATNFTVVPVSNSYLSVDYHDRDLMNAMVTYIPPTMNLQATLYGVRRWGSRVEVDLPPPGAARSWPGQIGYDTMLVFDQNEKGEWVGKIYPSLRTIATNDPHALLHLGYGYERDAFLYRNGSYQTLIAPTNYGGLNDIRLVFGLNNEGLMVGSCFDYDAYSNAWSWIEHYQPIIYRCGQTGTVLAVSTQAIGGAAYAVNDKGVIVGCEISANEVPRAVKWVNGNVAAVGGLTGATQSVAFDVSEDGAIAGMQKVSGQWRPFVVDPAGAEAFSPTALGGVDFTEFWHVGKFGTLGWGGSNSAQRLYWVVPDNDQDGFSDIVEQEIVDADPFDELTNIVDVAGSDDFDGDGLTNLQEWETQTDPLLSDSDGDRIPDGTDPLSMTRRDRDGDGLPDDWEDFYNLDPLSTNSTDGATGDPDGDGINNLEEFQLGGNPNSPADLGYVFHREKIGQLRVDLPDSIYCGGTNDHPPESVARCITFLEVTDTNLPPMEFTFKVSVTGRMEVHGFGDNYVGVNNQIVFTGPDEEHDEGCDMTNKTGYVLVKLNTSLNQDRVCIKYFSLGMHHLDAWAAVTDIELVDVRTNVHVLKVDSVNVHPDDETSQKITVDAEDNFVNIRSNEVVLIAGITPDTPEIRSMITWEADGATIISPAVGTDKRIAKLTSPTAKEIPIRIKIGDNTCWEGTVWYIWVDLVIDANGTLDQGNDASGLNSGPQWPAFLGGGNSLGAIDVESNPGFTYGAYAAWKVEIEGYLSPPGIETIIPGGWKMDRSVPSAIEWENAGSYDAQGQWQNQPVDEVTPPLDAPDTSQPPSLDEDPDSGTSVREIYDIDVPGTPEPDHHTYEKYINFDQQALIEFPSGVILIVGSHPWSYTGRVDMDKSGTKIDQNQLQGSHISIPSAPFYQKR